MNTIKIFTFWVFYIPQYFSNFNFKNLLFYYFILKNKFKTKTNPILITNTFHQSLTPEYTISLIKEIQYISFNNLQQIK